MYSPFPSTPSRGRSRFSKVLPTPPVDSSVAAESSPAPALTSRAVRTDLPTLPCEAVKAPKMAIARRPVGGVGGEVKLPARTTSIASVSSVYSDSPGLSRSLSDSSTKDSLSGIDSEDGPTPPLPPKDKDGRNQDEGPQTANKVSPNSISSLNNSPQRPEIWRRRSAKSDRSIVFPDLKLQKSNGSTASPPRRQEQQNDPKQLPRSLAGRKPVPLRAAPPQPDFMGNKISKLRKRGSSESSSKDEGPTQPAPQQYSTGPRLPTPDYVKTDRQQPLTPNVLSPVSPFTPPDDKPPLVPRKSESRSQASSQRSGSEATIVAPTHESVPQIKSPTKENLFSSQGHTRDTSDTLTITSEPAVRLSPQPQRPTATARILTPQPSPDKTSPLSLPSPVSHAQYFPTIQSPAARGTIFPGPALTLVHFDCYQYHKFMRSTNNRTCPVACMICERKDSEMRWRCAWCCLSACGSCMQVLSSVPGKDLRACLERLGK